MRLISAAILASVAALSSPATANEEAIARVVYAEAAHEPPAGKLAVRNTILNRLGSGRFGDSIEAVIQQRNAFEPVTRAGGWRNLPPLTEKQAVEWRIILDMESRDLLKDASRGATFFQNERVVDARRNGLTGFNGMPRTTVIANHTFYSPEGKDIVRQKPVDVKKVERLSLFIGDDETETVLVMEHD